MSSINSVFLFVWWTVAVRASLQQQTETSICAQRVEVPEANRLVCQEVCDDQPENGDYYDFRVVSNGVCYRKCNVTKAGNANNQQKRQNMETDQAETQSADVTESSTKTWTTGSFMEESSTWTPTADEAVHSTTAQSGAITITSVPTITLRIPDNSNNETEEGKNVKEPQLARNIIEEPTSYVTSESHDSATTEQAMTFGLKDMNLHFPTTTEATPAIYSTESSELLTVTNLSIVSATSIDTDTEIKEGGQTTQTEESRDSTIVTKSHLKTTEASVDSGINSEPATSETFVPTLSTPSPSVSSDLESQYTIETGTEPESTHKLVPMRTTLNLKRTSSDGIVTSERDTTGVTTLTKFSSHEGVTLVTSVVTKTGMPVTEQQPIVKDVTPIEPSVVTIPRTSSMLSTPNNSIYRTEEGTTVRVSSADKPAEDKLQLTKITTVELIQPTRPLITTGTDIFGTEQQAMTAPSIDLKSETITSTDSFSVSPQSVTFPRYWSQSVVSPTGSSNEDVFSTDIIRLTENPTINRTLSTTESSNNRAKQVGNHHTLQPDFLTSKHETTQAKLHTTLSPPFTEKITHATVLENLQTSETENSLETMRITVTPESVHGETSLVTLSMTEETKSQKTQTSLNDKLIESTIDTGSQIVTEVTKLTTTEKPTSSLITQPRQESLSETSQMPTTERILQTAVTHTQLSPSARQETESGFELDSVNPTVDSTTEPILSTVLLFVSADSQIPTIKQSDKTSFLNSTTNSSSVTSMSSSLPPRETEPGFKVNSINFTVDSTTEPTLPAVTLFASTESKIPTTKQPNKTTPTTTTTQNLSSTIVASPLAQTVSSLHMPSQQDADTTLQAESTTSATMLSVTESMLPTTLIIAATQPEISRERYSESTTPLRNTTQSHPTTVSVFVRTVIPKTSSIQSEFTDKPQTALKVSMTEATTSETSVLTDTENPSRTTKQTTIILEPYRTEPSEMPKHSTGTKNELEPVTWSNTGTHVTFKPGIPGTVPPMTQTSESLVGTLQSVTPELPVTEITRTSNTENSLAIINESKENSKSSSTLTQVSTKPTVRSRILSALMQSFIAELLRNKHSQTLADLIRPLAARLLTKPIEPVAVLTETSTLLTEISTVTSTVTDVSTAEQTVTAPSVRPKSEAPTSADLLAVTVAPTRLPAVVSLISRLHHCDKYPCTPSSRHPHNHLARLHAHRNKIVPDHVRANNCQLSRGRAGQIHNLQHCSSQPDPEISEDIPRLDPSKDQNNLIDNQRQQISPKRVHGIQKLDFLHEQPRHPNISDKPREYIFTNLTGKLHQNQSQLNDTNDHNKSSENRRFNLASKLHPQRTGYQEQPHRFQQIIHTLGNSQRRTLHDPERLNAVNNRLNNQRGRQGLNRLHSGYRDSSGNHKVHRPTSNQRLDGIHQLGLRMRHGSAHRQNLQNLRKQYLYSH